MVGTKSGGQHGAFTNHSLSDPGDVNWSRHVPHKKAHAMQHLSKLSLTVTSQKQPVSPVAKKRLNLLRKLELQIQAAEAELRDEEFLEEKRSAVEVL
jgi:hypothetical protein